MIGEQHRMVLSREPPHRLGQPEIVRRVIGDERQAANAHGVIGSDRRQHVRRVDIGERGDGNGICGVQMHHGAGLRPSSYMAR